MNLATFEPATVEDLRRLAPPNSALANPVDLTATVSLDQLRGALNIVLADVVSTPSWRCMSVFVPTMRHTCSKPSPTSSRAHRSPCC